MKKIYYEKKGSRYVPIAEYDNDFLDSFPKGTHLVMSCPGGQSRKYNIDPAYAPMIAAGRYAENAMLDVMRKASEGKPKRVALTAQQAEAWEAMKKAYGDDMFYITYPSNMDIVEAGVKAMQEEADKMMQNPSVKKAYEHFLLVWKLTKDETDE